MGVNPVFIRQTMAGLRDAGLLISVKATEVAGASQRASRDISLLDVYKALGEPVLIQQPPNTFVTDMRYRACGRSQFE